MWRWVVGLWVASRVAVIAAGVVLTDQLGWHRALAHWQVQPWTAVTGWGPAYYIELSHNGYHHNLSVAFFPLFPAAIWLVREVLHTGDAVTAMLVSNGAALIAMFGLYVLARDRLSERTRVARCSTWCCRPTPSRSCSPTPRASSWRSPCGCSRCRIATRTAGRSRWRFSPG